MIAHHERADVDGPPVEAGRGEVRRQRPDAWPGDVNRQERPDLVDDHNLAAHRGDGTDQEADVIQVGVDMRGHVHDDRKVDEVVRGYDDISRGEHRAPGPERIRTAAERGRSVVTQGDPFALHRDGDGRRARIDDAYRNRRGLPGAERNRIRGY